MVDEPLVSICIPTFNRAGMIDKAIKSALAQTYYNIEVIVVDNASRDNTAAVVATYTDKRLKYVKNERNLGLFGNFNRCVEVATGEYVHILHSDDYINPEFTASCMAFFKAHPSVVMTSTRARIVGTGFENDISYSDTELVYEAPAGFRRLLDARSFITCPSVMIRRDVYLEVGLYSLEYPYSSDFYQYLKIARVYDIGFVSGACLFYHQGEHSESFRFLFSSPQGYLDILRILIKLQIDLGQELDNYAVEFRSAMQRFIQDCLFAGFTRADAMPGFSPWFFSGLALTCWTLEKPASNTEWLGKIRDFLVILPAGLLMGWSPTRWMVKKLFFSGRKSY